MKYEKFEEWMIGKKFYHTIDPDDIGVIVGQGEYEEAVIVIYEKGGSSWAWLCNVNFVDSAEEKPSETKPIEWEVGQVVWDVLYGKGVVEEVHSGCPYPVEVKFADDFRTYTTDGKLGKELARTLFFSEPVITAELYPPKKPFVPTLKKGDVVLIKVKDELYGEGTVRTVHGESHDRVYISEEHHYFLKKDILSIRVLGEEVKFS